MIKGKTFLAVTAATFIAVASTAPQAGSTKPPAPTGHPNVSEEDRAFLDEAMKTGNTEVLAGQMAQQNASDPAIKQYAQQMVMEHRKNGEKLKQVAREIGYALPPQVDQMKNTEELAELRDLKGEEFDEAYAEAVVDAHQEAIDLYREHAEDDGVSEKLRQYARETLPHLEQHLAKAENLPPLQ